MPAEQNWGVRNHGRHVNISTPPPQELFPEFIPVESIVNHGGPEARIRSPARVTQRHVTPPPYEIFHPTDGVRAASPPLNPWNPYLRSYGRVYPYGLGVSQYENPSQNWMVANEPAQQRPLQNFQQSRVHLVPSFRDYNTNLSAMPLGESMRRTLSRPRSNRSFLHYRGTGGHSVNHHDVAEDENNSGYSSLPVIEISSDDEDEPRVMPVELTMRPNSNNSSSARSSFNHSNKENILIRQRLATHQSPSSRRTPAEVKPNIHAQMRRTSSEDSISSSANPHHHHHHHGHHHPHHAHQANDASALNLSNRMKRPHRYSPPQSQQNKHYRLEGEHRNSRQTPETTDSHSADNESPVQADKKQKPNVNEIDATINSTSASISQPINNDDDTNHVEQKFKIRIKREFKSETNNTSESADSESVVDTKEHLQPLIADIKQE